MAINLKVSDDKVKSLLHYIVHFVKFQQYLNKFIIYLSYKLFNVTMLVCTFSQSLIFVCCNLAKIVSVHNHRSKYL